MTDYKRLITRVNGICATNCINCETKRTWCSADQCEQTLLDYFCKLEDKIENGELVLKKEAVKEFAEYLKEYARACKASGYEGIGENDIDELLKEYENNGSK